MCKVQLSLFALFLLLAFKLSGQHEGDKWVIGYYSLGSPNYSIMHLDFSGPSLKIELHFNETMQMHGTCSNICDTNGDAILWTNGMQIFGKNGVSVTDTIAYDGNLHGYWNYFYSKTYGPFGFPVHDGSLILPLPGSNREYSVIYHSSLPHAIYGFTINKYLEARVRVNLDTTFTLVYQDSLIGEVHKWYTGRIIATRHANGRDWWIVTFEIDGPKYYSYLLDSKGIRLHHEDTLDMPIQYGLGQATFSNHGNYIARMDAITFDEGQYITLFSFDRCSGVVERLETFHSEAGLFTGVAFSPSDRYMYADDNTHLWQWDLLDHNISASQTLVDTFDGFIQPGWSQMRFGPMMTAPDGRIYIVPSAGSSEFMHVIERPDLQAADCRFLQHHINLTVPNARSAPNIPNFRLGPLDASECDTLELDNYPVANWRYEEDQPGWRHTIRFTDLSYYDPEQWHWDFNDGTTSDEMSPLHIFESGLYYVCLTVSNSNGVDTSCQWIEILPTSLEDDASPDAIEPDLSVYPNPFQNELQIKSRGGLFRKAQLQIYDMHGRLVINQPATPVPVNIYLTSLASGMYLCHIKDSDGTIYNFRVMKL